MSHWQIVVGVALVLAFYTAAAVHRISLLFRAPERVVDRLNGAASWLLIALLNVCNMAFILIGLRDSGERWVGLIGFASAVTCIAAIWRARARSRPGSSTPMSAAVEADARTPDEPSTLDASKRQTTDLTEYLRVVMLLLLSHGLLVYAYRESGSVLSGGSPEIVVGGKLVMSAVIFLIGQVSTAFFVRTLPAALLKDWRNPSGAEWSRPQQFGAFGLALVPCLAVSIAAGPLLFGVSSTLVLLWLTYRYTNRPVSTPLSMGVALLTGGRFPRADA